jgi:hypothetical protein
VLRPGRGVLLPEATAVVLQPYEPNSCQLATLDAPRTLPASELRNAARKRKEEKRIVNLQKRQQATGEVGDDNGCLVSLYEID